MRSRRFRWWWAVCLFMLANPVCRGATDGILTGAGATFPAPLYKRWIETYFRETGVRVTYEAVGSGGGIRQLYARSVDWGGTDAFISNEDLPFTPAPIVHFPTCMGAVAILCHIPNVGEVRLTPEILGDVFCGRITSWADRRFVTVDGQPPLPDLAITVVHRADESGTTFILSEYLTRTSSRWRNTLGRGRRLAWPVGLGVSGSEALLTMVERIPGAIGYMELT